MRIFIEKNGSFASIAFVTDCVIIANMEPVTTEILVEELKKVLAAHGITEYLP